MARHTWNTPMPPLDEIRAAANRVAEDGEMPLDVHTVKVTLNGQHGGWDVRLEATDEDMADVTLVGILSPFGALQDLTEEGA